MVSTAAQLNSSRIYISELKNQKEKFEDMSKYASKLQTVLERPSTPQPIIGGVAASLSLATGNDIDDGKRKVSSQRTLMTETKLSSRLIRLESLVKASNEEQLEILRRIELIKEERGLKDARYARLIAQACKLGEGGENQVEDLLEKIEETM